MEQRFMEFKQQVVIVCGEICSGKDTFCGTIGKTHEQIVVSNVVRSIVGVTTRSGLSATGNLDEEITIKVIREIRRRLDYFPYQKVVINGIRQLSIYLAILKEIELKQHSHVSVWLDVPREILEERYISRAAKKDDQTFKEAIAKDNALGLAAVRKTIHLRKNKLVIKNHK